MAPVELNRCGPHFGLVHSAVGRGTDVFRTRKGLAASPLYTLRGSGTGCLLVLLSRRSTQMVMDCVVKVALFGDAPASSVQLTVALGTAGAHQSLVLNENSMQVPSPRVR